MFVLYIIWVHQLSTALTHVGFSSSQIGIIDCEQWIKRVCKGNSRRECIRFRWNENCVHVSLCTVLLWQSMLRQDLWSWMPSKKIAQLLTLCANPLFFPLRENNDCSLIIHNARNRAWDFVIRIHNIAYCDI